MIIASGLMAGGALGGVLGAACRGYQQEWIQTPFYSHEAVSQTVAAILFIALCAYVWQFAIRNRRLADAENPLMAGRR